MLKKMLCLLLALTVLLGLDGCGAKSEMVNEGEIAPETIVATGDLEVVRSPFAPTDEYERAVWYGFLPEGMDAQTDADKEITWKRYCQMISNMIALYRPEKQEAWEDLAASAMKVTRKMDRDQGCFALFQAITLLELPSQAFSLGYTVNPFMIPSVVGWPEGADYSPFAGVDTSMWESGNADYGYGEDNNFVNSAIFTCHQRTSLASFSPLYTSEKKITETLTVRDALLSVVRLYESDLDVAQKLWLERIDLLSAEVEALGEPEKVTEHRNAILESPTTIVKSDTFIPGETYTGTAYYVSNSGDDKNDGQSPETAWATLDRVSNANLKSGDIVFFERGGTFRGNLYLWQRAENLTLSAYGEGPKPIITSAPEDAADPGKWELYWEADGKKIWKFYRDITDCGLIVLNDNRAAVKERANWSGSEWVNADGSPYDITVGLEKDLRFFNDDGEKFGGQQNWSIFEAAADVKKDGPLYLRCDAGNPGELYDSIELCAIPVTKHKNNGFETTTINPVQVRILDNLSVKYFCAFGMAVSTGCVVQNCEFAWGGGVCPNIENGAWPARGQCGDALVAGWASDLTVRNNYFHDIMASALTLESYSVEDFGPEANVNFMGNLVERSGMSVNIDYEEKGGRENAFVGTIDNFQVRENAFYQMGLGWGNRYALEEDWGAEVLSMCIQLRQREYVVNSSFSDNSFYYPLNFAFNCGMDQANMPEMGGNEFYFTPHSGKVAYWKTGEKAEAFRPIGHEEAESFLRDFCGDTTSKIHYVEP